MKNPTLLLFVLLPWPAFQAPAAEPERADFARDVRPILERSCWKCHGPEKQKGGLRLDLRTAALGVGDSGSRAITPGKADESELIRRVETADVEERMPPKSDPLGRDEIRVLRAWIDQGAAWPETAAAAAGGRKAMVVTAEDRRHWSYRPLTHVDLPGVRDAGWCRTPIDRFVLSTPGGTRHSPERPGRPAHPDPPGLFRPARPAAFARGGEGVPRGPGARRL